MADPNSINELRVRSYDADSDAAVIQHTPGRGARVATNQHALTVIQDAVSGDGSALVLRSSNSEAPALHIAGGTINQSFALGARGATSFSDLPNGRTGHDGAGGLFMVGSFAGGEDNGQAGQFDSSMHINFYSHQRAQSGSYGESVRHYIMEPKAKSMLAWWFPKAGYTVGEENDLSLGWTPTFWIGAHAQANDGLSWHMHGAVEAMSESNGLTTRLEFPFVNEGWVPGDPVFVTKMNIRTHDADFTVSADSGVLRVGGGDGVNKDILLSHSSLQATSGERWKIRATLTAESGSNVGTDFVIRRHADSGSVIESALFIKRSTGNIGIATETTTGARLTASWGTSGLHAFLASASASVGNGAAFAAVMFASTERYVDCRVSGDSLARFVVTGAAVIEFGNGTVRDVNLYRNDANELKTDDKFLTTVGIGVGNSAAGNTLGSLTKKIEVFDAAGDSIGFLPVYDAITQV